MPNPRNARRRDPTGPRAADMSIEAFLGRSPHQPFNLKTEPWVFAFDRNGKVAARLEGAYSVAELEQVVKEAEGS